MDKLKNVLSHGSKKGAHGEGTQGSHSGGATHQEQGTTESTTSSSEYHPIYDQFAKTSGSSNTTDLNPTHTDKDFASSTRHGESASSSIRPDATLGRPDTLTDETSTASIKSGIMGHPQGGNHLSSQNQTNSILPDRTATSQHHESSHTGRDAALGTGVLGAGAGTTHGLHRQKDHDDLRATEHGHPPFEKALDPIVATDTDRSFPLAGGVSSRKQAEHHPIGTNDSHLQSTDGSAGVSEGYGYGREGLAGAAAAATTNTSTSDALRSEQEPPSVNPQQQQAGYLGQARQTAANVANTVSSTASTALAGATAAWQGHKVDHPGHVHDYQGDPCSTDNSSSANFIQGPHKTDTANALDPQVHGHIPGEFPETPLETPGDRGRAEEYMSGTNISGASRQPEGSSAPLTASHSTDRAHSPDHHGLGKTAGLGAAGLGAAGAGAYAAGKHHDREPTDIETNTMSNPYSSKQLDPRVHPGQPGQLGSHALDPLDDQRFDPKAKTSPSPHAQSTSTKDHHHGRDAGVLGAGAATAAGLSSASHRDGKLDSTPHATGREATTTKSSGIPSTTQHRTTQPTGQIQDDSRQKDHHYGRDAGLIGAGAATAGGLYAAGRHDDKPESSPRASGYETSPTTGSGTTSIPQHGMTQNEPHQKDHHYGRDAGLIGAGAAGAGGLYHAGQPDEKSRSGQAYPTSGSTTGNNMTSPGMSSIPQQATTHQTSQLQDESPKDHHYGRNAGLAGAGAATAGGLYYANQRDDKPDSGPASSTIGPHSSNVEPHHLGKGAAGGAAVTGIDAHQVTQNYGDHRSTQPSAAMQNQRYDTSAPGAHDPNQTSHHYGRDAALGAGAGALAHEALKKDNETSHPTHRDPTSSNTRGSGLTGHNTNEPVHDSKMANKLDPRVSTGEHTTPHSSTTRTSESTTSRSPTTHTSSRVPGVHNYPPENYPSHNYPPENYPSKKFPRIAAAAQGPDYVPEKHRESGEETRVDDRHHDDHHHDDHHHGRDAAGAAAAGAGLYAASKHNDHAAHGPVSQQPTSQQAGITHDSISPHHGDRHGRDAGARDAGLYEAAKHHGSASHGPVSQQAYSQQAGITHSPTVDQQRSGHHYGRDAGLAAGAGAAGAGIYGASKHHDSASQGPVSQQPTSQVAGITHEPTSHHQQSTQHSQIPVATQNSPLDQQRSEHHYGRDAGLAAGAGAAGAGIYGASKHHDSASQGPVSQQPTSQVAGITHEPASRHQQPGQHSQIPVAAQHSPMDQQRSEHHYGRDAGLGAGAGAAGLYAASKHHDKASQGPISQQPTSQGAGITQDPTSHHSQAYGSQAPTTGHQTYGSQAPVAGQQNYPRDGDVDQREDHHYGRNAGLAAGAGAVGAGAYAHHQDSEKERLAHEKELEHQRREEQKALEKKQKAEQKVHDKEVAHEQKAHEKELAHQQKEEHHALLAQQKAAEKQQVHDQKEHDKVLAREEAHRQKEIEKENARQQKEVERVASHEKGEKKHGMLGFLHKDKSHSPEHSPRTSLDAGLEGRNKLHKNPPPGHPAWEVMGDNKGPQHLGSDGRPDQISQDDHLHSGVYEAPHPNDQGRFVTDPNTGIARNIGQGNDQHGAMPPTEGAAGYRQY